MKAQYTSIFAAIMFTCATSLMQADPELLNLRIKSYWPGYPSGRIYDIEKQADYIFGTIHEHNDALIVVDIRDPAKPIAVGGLTLDKLVGGVFGWDLEVFEETVIISGPQTPVIDISDPLNPKHVLTLPMPSGDIEIIPGWALMTGKGSMWILDLDSLKGASIDVQEFTSSHVLSDIAVQGTLAFVSCQDGFLEIIDVSQPWHPVRLSDTVLNGVPGGVGVVNKTAFVKINRSQMVLLDVRDPNQPSILNYFDGVRQGSTFEVIARGNMVIAGGMIFDVSNPSNPAYLGDLPLGYVDLELHADILYASSGTGVTTYDLSDFFNPVPLGDSEMRSIHAVSVAVNESLAYLPDEYQVHMIDVRDPLNPQFVSDLDFRDAESLKVQGDKAFIRNPYRLGIFDISDRVNPVELSELDLVCCDWCGVGLALQNQVAYVDMEGKLGVADVTFQEPFPPVYSREATLEVVPDVTPPFLIGASADESLTRITVTFNEAMNQQYATDPFNYLVKQGNDVVNVYSVEAKSHWEMRQFILSTDPLEASTLYTVTALGVADAQGNIDIEGSSMEFCSKDGACSSTFAPVTMPGINSPDILSAGGIMTVGPDDLILEEGNEGAFTVSAYADGLWPQAFVYDWQEWIDGAWQALPIHGEELRLRRVTFQDSGRRFRVIISQKTSPYFMVVLPFGVYGDAFDVVGNLVYTYYGIFDINNLADPIQLSAYDFHVQPSKIKVVDGIAYFCEGEAGLLILDVNDPTNPRRLSRFKTDGSVRDLKVVGNRVYFADFWAGIKVLDVREPENPILVGSLETRGRASSIEVVGNHIYVADGQWGLAIIEEVPSVINPRDSIEELISVVQTSGLPYRRQLPLLASLKAAQHSLENSQVGSARNQMKAMQKKVRAQIARIDPGLANVLIRTAQEVMDAMGE